MGKSEQTKATIERSPDSVPALLPGGQEIMGIFDSSYKELGENANVQGFALTPTFTVWGGNANLFEPRTTVSVGQINYGVNRVDVDYTTSIAVVRLYKQAQDGGQ